MTAAYSNHWAMEPRHSIANEDPGILADIYRDDCNVVTWRRKLSPELRLEVAAFLQTHKSFQTSMSLSPESAQSSIHRALGGNESLSSLSADIAELVDMFCWLFEVERVGLRMTALEQPMCPRFHVDHVPCRLITTYQGPATEWLPHNCVARSKLGSGSGGMPDESSGLFQNPGDIQRAHAGDVLLLKGERWEGNEGAGLVHRSPSIPAGDRRLLLTLDLLL
ncbi:MAG: DUF1826 domain-containing protein [Pseudomonadales bacterium]